MIHNRERFDRGQRGSRDRASSRFIRECGCGAQCGRVPGFAERFCECGAFGRGGGFWLNGWTASTRYEGLKSTAT